MRISTKGRYAISAMVDIAKHGASGPVTIAGVADRLLISASYLEQLFGKLRKAGLLDSVRGPGGGYRLIRPPKLITAADIIAAVDRQRRAAPADKFWSGLDAVVDGYLAATTLDTLIADSR